ncbi:hypothetical protein [Paenibacillus wynnii]|uniref:Group-specific protein n=1 Tax=Paenibacillus wynnii TaxID=268407 RepID=A0A098MC95_9BACL|nr:hypothetical protein [Paenibacillus wynnii]KGE19651.1 hypothetical protein PWYN_10080 [Paenibacillus wynnii]
MDLLSPDPVVEKALLQFIFPFSIKQGESQELEQQLVRDGFTRFYLDKSELEDAYYGEGYCVSHKNMERVYLPFAAHVLFPKKEDKDSFHRFSRVNGLDCLLEMPLNNLPFRILSTDVFLCPFQLGFVTIRVDLGSQKLPFSRALEFADRFRTLEDVSKKDSHTHIHHNGRVFEQVGDFVFSELVPGLRSCLDSSELSGAYFETLPYFVDERMLVQAFYQFEEDAEIDIHLRYRASQLDGINLKGQPHKSASDPTYIDNYCSTHSYNRWGPNTYYMTNEQTFCCLTREGSDISTNLANEMYGEYYYGLLLSVFHKIVLLKLANMHSRLRIDNDYEQIENLIYSINRFSAKFYFLELISQSQGREIFLQMRKVYGNDALFVEVKQTLDDLFQYQDKFQSKRRDNLLMILTVYTVISGIYGMNQVIEDLKGQIKWSKMLEYSPFEYLALFLAMTGIVVSLSLTVRALWGRIQDRRKKRFHLED